MKSKRISSLTNSKAILKFCKDYAATCEEQEVQAQNKMEIFSFLTCLGKKYQYWKMAAEKGKEVFNELIKKMGDPRMTIKQFKGFVEERSVHFRIHAEENNGSYWFQIYRLHAEKLMDVFVMIEEGQLKRKTQKEP